MKGVDVRGILTLGNSISVRRQLTSSPARVAGKFGRLGLRARATIFVIGAARLG